MLSTRWTSNPEPLSCRSRLYRCRCRRCHGSMSCRHSRRRSLRYLTAVIPGLSELIHVVTGNTAPNSGGSRSRDSHNSMCSLRPACSTAHWSRNRKQEHPGRRRFGSPDRIIGHWHRTTVYRVAVLERLVTPMVEPIRAITVMVPRVAYIHRHGQVRVGPATGERA
jgi:hypothetical protein